MGRKTILILLDACRFDLAEETAGYLEHLIERSCGAKYCVQGELPSQSRPMYETTMTGLPSSVHGITDNEVVRRSDCENLFSLCRQNGLKTAAAAYYWMSELYYRAPFCPECDRYLAGNGDSLIDYGIFYYEDIYPDSHLYMDAEFLRKTYHPDFLLIHPMNIDDSGHRFGGDSPEYLRAGLRSFELIARLLPGWLSEGYQVVVTADHGMSAGGYHGGNREPQRLIPLYIFADGVKNGDFSDRRISQLNTAPLVCRLLGIPPAEAMMQELEIEMAD